MVHKPSKSERKLAVRKEAKAKVRGGGFGRGTSRTYREGVEAGRQHLLLKSAQGGDSKAKQVKNELNFLINNYLPSYDTRIEHLMEEWRRSGDPEYDPGIRLRLRQARRKHMEESSPA